MLPDSFVNRHKSYLSTYGHPASTAEVEHYRSFMRGGPGGAYDAAAKPRRRVLRLRSSSRNATFAEVCQHGRMAFDDNFMRRNGNIIAPSGKEIPECLEDASPLPQPEVESTADNQPDHGPKGAAAPWGEHDMPRYGREEPMEPHGDQVEAELPSERTREPATVRAGQQGGDQEHADRGEDEAQIARVLERLGYSSPEVRKAMGDRVRKARDQGPPVFPGRPSAFAGSEHGKLAGDSRFAFLGRFSELAQGQPAITPKALPIDRRAPFRVR
jgi:hypothetical protein